MELLREAIRNILLEVGWKEASKSIELSVTKIVKAWNYDNGRVPEYNLQTFVNMLSFDVGDMVPDDIEDNQKGLSVLWVLKTLKNDKATIADLLEAQGLNGITERIRNDLEIFFQWQRFMSVKDLNQVKSFGELSSIVLGAKARIKEYQDKQTYLDADQGQEILRDDAKWFIAIVHNKGAACELGKGTSWCTAAPGLEYFKHYYRPDDPIFIFRDKSNGDRYQVHLGSNQFMDEANHLVDESMQHELLLLLKNTNVSDRYPDIDIKIKLKHAGNPYAEVEDLQDVLNIIIASDTDQYNSLPQQIRDAAIAFVGNSSAPIELIELLFDKLMITSNKHSIDIEFFYALSNALVERDNLSEQLLKKILPIAIDDARFTLENYDDDHNRNVRINFLLGLAKNPSTPLSVLQDLTKIKPAEFAGGDRKHVLYLNMPKITNFYAALVKQFEAGRLDFKGLDNLIETLKKEFPRLRASVVIHYPIEKIREILSNSDGHEQTAIYQELERTRPEIYNVLEAEIDW